MPYSELSNACEAIIISLADITAQGVADFSTPIGFSQALLDPANRRGVDLIQSDIASEGHTRNIRVVYKQRGLASEITDEKDCETGEEKPFYETSQDIALEKHITVTINEDTLRRFCRGYSDYMRVPAQMRTREGGAATALNLLRELVVDLELNLDAFRREINAELLAAYAAKVGTFVGGAASKTYDFIRADTHALVPKGFNLMRQDLGLVGAPGNPIVFGYGNLDLAVMSAGYGCCNAQGQEVGQAVNNARLSYYQDIDAGTALGNANAFGIFLPGWAQLLTWNKYVGEFARPIGAKERGTWADPLMPGMKYDFSLEPNTCKEYYDLKIDAYFDLFVAPDDLFATGDRLAGVNGTFKAVANAVA